MTSPKSTACLALPKPPRRAAAPRDLGTAGRRFWREVVRVFVLEAWDLPTLEVACRALDQMREAQAILGRDGLILDGRAHPAVKLERDAATRFLRAKRELRLDIEPSPSVDNRPPALRGGHGRLYG